MSKQKPNKVTAKETDVIETEESAEVEAEDTSISKMKDTVETVASLEEITAQEETMDETGSEVGTVEAEEDTAVTKEEEEPVVTLETELELARQEAAKNLDNWQRAVAELANYKRRQEEQRKLQRDRIKSEVLQGVVSALDDMDLAFQNLPGELDGQLVGWVEGFRLVQRKLDKILDDQNVMPIGTEGKFDPNFHEAVSYEENEDHEEGDIIAELRKGYQIGNRIIRPALVRVAR
jgi:molecular chaperone GrpE